MFERFTRQSRRVVVLAQEEARALSHNYIGTEHILLGLLREGKGSAARALESVNVTLAAARDQVVAIVGRGQEQPPGHIPFTPLAKKSLELSLREALQLGDNYIGTGHLLRGLIRHGDNAALRVLGKLGADPEDLRARVTQELHDHPENEDLAAAKPDAVKGLLDSIDDRLGAIEERLGITGPGAAGPGELELLRARVDHLEAQLREHGVDPDDPGEPPAAAGLAAHPRPQAATGRHQPMGGRPRSTREPMTAAGAGHMVIEVRTGAVAQKPET